MLNMNSALKPVLQSPVSQNSTSSSVNQSAQLNKPMHPQSSPNTYGQPSTHMPQSLVNLPHNQNVAHNPNPAHQHQTNHYLNVPNAPLYSSNNPGAIQPSNHPIPSVSQSGVGGGTHYNTPPKNYSGGYQPNLGHPPNQNPIPPVSQTLPATTQPIQQHATEMTIEKPQSNGTPELKSPTKQESQTSQENHVVPAKEKPSVVASTPPQSSPTQQQTTTPSITSSPSPQPHQSPQQNPPISQSPQPSPQQQQQPPTTTVTASQSQPSPEKLVEKTTTPPSVPEESDKSDVAKDGSGVDKIESTLPTPDSENSQNSIPSSNSDTQINVNNDVSDTTSNEKETTKDDAEDEDVADEKVDEKKDQKDSIDNSAANNGTTDGETTPKNKEKEQKTTPITKTTPSRTPTRKSKTPKTDGESPAKVSKAQKQETVVSTPTTSTQKSPSGNSASGIGKSKRIRTRTQPYQSPLPEIEIITKISSSTPKSKNSDEKLIAFYKNEFLAVRNSEGSFYICQAVQNIYKSSPKIRIRWLSQDKNDKTGEVYTPDFYDMTDFDCILTNLNLERVDKGKYRLPPAEKERTDSILKRSLAVEKGEVTSPSLTEEHPDGIDLSLYKEESQLKKRKGTKRKASSSPSKSGKKTNNAAKSPEQAKVRKVVKSKKVGRNSTTSKKAAANSTSSAATTSSTSTEKKITTTTTLSRTDRLKRRSDNQNHNKVSPVVDQKKAKVLAKVARKPASPAPTTSNKTSENGKPKASTSKAQKSTSKAATPTPASSRKTKRSRK